MQLGNAPCIFNHLSVWDLTKGIIIDSITRGHRMQRSFEQSYLLQELKQELAATSVRGTFEVETR